MSDKEEIIKILSDPKTVKQVVENVFAEVDTDKSGFIERNEFEVVAKKISTQYGAPEPSQQEINEALAAIDANGDGKISKGELANLIKAIFSMLIEDIKNS